MKKTYLVITEFTCRTVWIDRFTSLKAAKRSFKENVGRMCSRCQLVVQLTRIGNSTYHQVLDLYVREF